MPDPTLQATALRYAAGDLTPAERPRSRRGWPTTRTPATRWPRPCASRPRRSGSRRRPRTRRSAPRSARLSYRGHPLAWAGLGAAARRGLHALGAVARRPRRTHGRRRRRGSLCRPRDRSAARSRREPRCGRHCHALRAQQLGPDRRDGLFRLVGGRLVPARRERVRVGRGERPAVHLAVGGQRQRVEAHVRRGDHVLGQPRREMRPQRLRVRRRAAHHVGHQAPVAGRILAGQHHGLAHQRMLAEPRLDLAQLDAVAAHLDLVVDAAQELQRRRRGATAPGRRCGTAAPPPRRRTGRARSARPSAPAGPGTRAPPARRRCTARPRTPTGHRLARPSST